ncbi:MAG TPA: hypothetical protein VI685_12680 [Candidatus Angelobacter sp.]
MGRSESKQVEQQQSQQSAQDQANAQASLAGENAAIANAQKAIGQYGSSIWNTFRPGGEFSKNMTTLATSANSGGQNSYEDYLNNMATRTGSGSTPQMVAASEQANRQGRRDVANTLATDENARIAALENGMETQEGMLAQIPGMYGGEYSSSVGGAGTAGGNAVNAAKTPGFWDTFLPALAGAGGQVGAGFAKSCWIAEAIYGVGDARTHLVRAWLNTEFKKSLLGRLVMALYFRFGRSAAALVQKHEWLKAAFKPLFDKALQMALTSRRGSAPTE